MTTTTNVLPGTGNGEIAFIDTSIAGYQTLLDGLREGVEAVLIDGAHDGVAQIAAALVGRSGIEAVHIFTHGAPGVLQLGATRLDEAGLADHEADLGVLRSALADGADLLLYGCNVAAGAVGESFLQALSAATGVHVAASIDPSGSALLGGDWELEANVGAIEASSALAPETLTNFSGLLAVGNLDFDGEGYEQFGRLKEVDKDGWTFTSTVAVEMAVLDESSGIIASMMRDSGRLDDGIMWLNYEGLDENNNPIDAREFSVSSTDGSAFKLESLRLGQLVGSDELPTASTLTITAYRNDKIVGVAETVDLRADDKIGNIHYSVEGGSEDFDRFGKLSFDSTSSYDNIDKIVFTFSGITDLQIDDIQVGAPVADERKPLVSEVSVPENGTYGIGDELSFTVTFDENITVDGKTSKLTLDIGGVPRTATYDTESDNSITYTYKVQAGDIDANGITVGELDLAGSTISDTAGNPADPTLNDVGATTGVRVDGIAPTIAGIIAPPDAGTYVAGSTLTFEVTFSENVIIDESSLLGLRIGNADVFATYASKTANSAFYTYTVQAGYLDIDGIAITSLAPVPGGSIRDAAGNDANLDLAGHLPSLDAVLVDAVAPAVSGNITIPAADSYRAGDTLTFVVTFTENVDIANAATSTLGLTIGSTARSASYSTNNNNSLTYTYTIQPGDNDADGITIGAIGQGGMIVRDAAGNDAVLSLTGHVPSAAGILVDTRAPSVLGNIAVPANGYYTAGDYLDFSVTFDENIDVSGTDSTLTLTIGGTQRSAILHDVDGNSVTYRYTVQAGDLDADGIQVGAIVPGASTFRDVAGNAADLALDNHVPNTVGVRVDAIAPTILGNISAPADRLYIVGEELRFTVRFSEDIALSGTASTLALNIGGIVRQAVYDDHDSNSITYRYAIQSGDNDGDGIEITGLALNGGSIRDIAANSANLSLDGHLPALDGVRIDGGAPDIFGTIAVPAAGSYGVGEVLRFEVTFNENITVVGQDSTLSLSIGSAVHSASYVESTANSIIYSYTVQAGDTDANGIEIGDIVLNGTTIRDAAGNDAGLSLTGHRPSTAGVLVDTTAPAVAGTVTVPLPGTYVAGQALDFVITLDEDVTVSGTGSTLGLTVGTAGRKASFVEADGNTITYRYIVQPGDLDANGIGIGGITLGTSTIRDAAGNDADLALAAYLPSTDAILVDGTAPAISGLIAAPDDKTYTAGDTLTFTVPFTENIDVVGSSSTLELDVGGTPRSATFVNSTPNSITYSYTVQPGDNDADGIAITGLALNGSTIRDNAGNNANLALAGHLPPLGAVRVDTEGPALATATVNGNRMVLSFADAGALDAAHPPAVADFTITVAGEEVTVTGVTVDAGARTVTLTLSTAVTNGQAVTVAYADQTPNDANAIQDALGNDAASFGVTPVVNNTPAPPTNPPTNPPTEPPTNPPSTGNTVDGVTLQTGTVVRSDGSVAQVVTVPIVPPSRQEQVGNNNVADIPLVKAADGSSLLTVQVPTGAGLQSIGSGAPKRAGDSLTDLIREIQAHTASGSHDQNQLTGGGGGFLDILDADTPLLVQTIVLSGNGGTADVPLGIIGQPQQAGSVQSALVIDARSLSSGATIELQHASFAAIIGAATVTGGAGNQHVLGDGASQTIILGEGDDVLHGGAGDDIIGSGAGDDMIHGDEGDDLIFGGKGNDYLDGGVGHDTARFSGAADGYSLRLKDGLLVMTDRMGSDGIDTVAAVEVLRFTGGQSMADDAVLARLYEGVLGRQASAAEVAWWQDVHVRGASLQQIAAAIIDSPEAAQALGRADDDAFVAGLYQSVLGRTAAAAESDFWTGLLADGVDRATVALGFVNSAEKLASSLDVDFNHSDVAVLARMYHAMFGRAPDEAGLNFWLERHEDGVSLGAIADAFVVSAEAQGLAGHGSDAAFIDQLFATALDRAPSSGEKTLLLEQLQNGVYDRGQVLLDVAESVESIAIIGAIDTSLDLL